MMSNILMRIVGRRLASTQHGIGDRMKMLNEKREYRKALELFNTFNENNIEQCSNWTVIQALKACTETNDIARGVKIHNLVATRLKTDSYVLPSLIHFYMQIGDVTRAQSLYDTSAKKSLFMHGSIMKGYIKNGAARKAIDLFYDISQHDKVVTILLFNACAQLATDTELNLLRKVSSTIPASFYSDARVLTSLIDAFMKCNDVASAKSLFYKSSVKALSMYNVMMKGYIINNMPQQAIDLFNDIKHPNEITISTLFSACARLRTDKELKILKTISSKIPISFYSNRYVLTSIIDAFMKCGDVVHAKSILDRSSIKLLSMYNAMMKGYILNNMCQKAIDMFSEIKEPNEITVSILFGACAQLGTDKELQILKNISSKLPVSFYKDPYVVTSLIDAFMKCGDVENAKLFFNKSEKKTLPMYGALLKGLANNGQAEEAIDVFNDMSLDELQRENLADARRKFSLEMREDYLETNKIIYLCLIKAFSKIGMSDRAQAAVQKIPTSFLTDNVLQNALIDMWGKVGCVDEAKRIFEQLTRPDGIAYTAMINSYGLNGMGTEAIEIFRQIPKEYIDDFTYVSVLNASSHSGLVDEARLIFNNIPIKTDKIYTTMIDCLSRISAFEEAQNLIKQYELDRSPEPAMYMALLSGARNANNAKVSQEVVDRMHKLFPDSKKSLFSASILLANTYASSGDIDKAAHIRNELHKSGHKKEVGITLTDIDGKIFKFRAHDQSHPLSKEIYEEADRISRELVEHGHKYDGSWIMRPIGPDETIETVLCGHSERLAIAAHFIRNRKPKRIQMTKNLRVCRDCHRATKLIAMIRQCEIVVRDANRIHHFHTNGQCSCQDHF